MLSSLLLLCALSPADAGAEVADPAPVPPSFDNYRAGFSQATLMLQILLDRQNFSCNCVDGVWGARTETALATWQLMHGLSPTGVPDVTIFETLGGFTNILEQYIVTAEDHAAIGGPVPGDWEARARLDKLAYETIQEMLAEKGHTSQRALARLNPQVLWPNPPVGTSVVMPSVPETKLPRAGSIRISLSRTEITVFDAAGTLVALFPCSIALSKAKRPEGEVRVTVVAPDPNYTYDPQLFEPGSHKTAKLIIPAGPNNPVGLAWIGLSLQGYGIHGTPIPENIGRAESKGCFRLTNWNAVKLLRMVEIGTPVVVED